MIGSILILVIASLAEMNRRYTHSYICACHAAHVNLSESGDDQSKIAEKRWNIFRYNNEKPWRRPWSRWLLSWSTYAPGLVVGIYLILRGGIANVNLLGGLGLGIGIITFLWWIYLSRKAPDLSNLDNAIS